MGLIQKSKGIQLFLFLLLGLVMGSCNNWKFMGDNSNGKFRCGLDSRLLNLESGNMDLSNEVVMPPNLVFDYCIYELDKHVGLSKDSAGIADASDFKKSFPSTYSRYTVLDQSQIEAIRNKLEGIYRDGWSVEIQIIGGNWCSDTRDGLPVFARVLDQVNFLLGSEKEKLVYLRVDRSKKYVDSSSAEVRRFISENPELVVTRVPLVRVVLLQGLNYKIVNLDKSGDVASTSNDIKKLKTRLLGEIVEVAYPSWEAELLKILNNY